jgi:hypothetical protein
MSDDKDAIIARLTKALEHWRHEVGKKQSQIDNLKFELKMLWVLVNKELPKSVVGDMAALGTGIIQGGKRVDPEDFYIKSEGKTMSNNGGPAFPAADYGQFGMTLRDWFSGQALVGVTSNPENSHLSYETVARESYKLADALIEVRETPSD